MTTFYIVRHGETEWNRQGLLQGHGDSPLTLEGERQLRSLAQLLAPIHFDQVFSSDLMRARRSAELLAIDRQLAVNTTHLLRERTFGRFEGKSREFFQMENKALIERYATLSGADKWKFRYAEDMESDEDVVTRLLTFLREAAVTYEGKMILVVAHGGVMRVLLSHLGKTVVEGAGKVKNSAYMKLASDGVDFFLEEAHDIELVEQ